MIFYPAPMQWVAIALSSLFPLFPLALAKARAFRGSGARYVVACVIATVVFFVAFIILPGEHDLFDALSGFLILATAMLFWNVIWSLLAFGFTLTLLTALVQAGRPLTRSQWVTAYMQGADLRKFARNRLQLLIGTGMAKYEGNNIVATPFGSFAATFVRSTRLLFGIR